MKVDARDLRTGRPIAAELLPAGRARRAPRARVRAPARAGPTIPMEIEAARRVGAYVLQRFRARHGNVELVLQDLGDELLRRLAGR